MKGFIRSLEAIMASLLLLGMTFSVAPQVHQAMDEDDPTESMESRLVSLEESGKLNENISRESISEKVSEAVPSGYNYDVVLREREFEESLLEFIDGETVDYDLSGDIFTVQLFIESASDLNASYGGEKFVEMRNEPGYASQRFASGTETLEFEGDADLTVRFHNSSLEGDIPEEEQIVFVSHPLAENQTEVRVAIWRDRSS